LPDAAPLTAAEGGRQVERAHRSHVQEFYDYYAGELSVAAVNQALRAWELTYNTVRPHRALKLKSPLSYLRAEHPERAPPVSNVLNSYKPLPFAARNTMIRVMPALEGFNIIHRAGDQAQRGARTDVSAGGVPRFVIPIIGAIISPAGRGLGPQTRKGLGAKLFSGGARCSRTRF
jgi:hypothetical protein